MLPANTLFAFAMEREARPFQRRRPDSRIVITGVGPQYAADAIANAITQQRPDAIVMSGFAGALIAELKVGDIVVATDIVENSNMERGSIAKTLVQLSVAATAPHAVQTALHGRILTTDRIIGRPAEKHGLAMWCGAVAVDMESASVARVSNEHNIPWYAVRVISDGMNSELSSELLELLNGGIVSITRSFWAVLQKPRLLAEFRRLARDTRLAADRLGRFLDQVAG